VLLELLKPPELQHDTHEGMLAPLEGFFLLLLQLSLLFKKGGKKDFS